MAGKKKKARKKVRGKTQPKKDPLAEAVRAKEKTCTISRKKLLIRKWTLRLSLKLGSKVANVAKQIAPTGELTDLMLVDFDDVVANHTDDFIEILLTSVMLGETNFEDEASAEEWIEDLDAADALELFTVIAELNLRPLLQKVLALAEKLKLGPLKKAVGASRT